MQFLASFTERTPLLAQDVPAGELSQAFGRHPEARVLAVGGADGVVLGLVERTAVERALREGRADQTAGALMIGEPLAMAADHPVREAIALLATHPEKPDVLVAMKDGAYLGLCSLRRLAQALLTEEPPAAPAHVDEAVDERIERLFGAAEAEFRGQVQGLLAMTDRLSRQHLSPDALAQVHSIHAAGENLLRLAADAKDMMHARQGQLELKPRAQALRALMDEVQGRWTGRARETGVGLLISYDGDPDLAAVVDPDRLAQVFDGLIDNALRYTRHGSIEAALRARVDGERAVLEGRVRDTGAEMSAARLSHMFDPAGPGVSLPLSLTHAILSSMGGSIRAENNLGQGATIVFELSAEIAGEPAAPAESRPVSGAPHVLVVDDNATNRMVAEALCEMFECTSETAEDGLEAIEQARTGRFDLILMDIKMPHMDGIAATQAIRALDGPAGQVPVVALTANVDPEDARTYLAAGMCCVVEKPIKPDRLLQAINIALSSGPGGARRDGDHVAAA